MSTDVLRAMLRCPGVDLTDQETGETFRDLIDAAIVNAPEVLEAEEVTWTWVDAGKLPDYGVEVLVTDGKSIAHCARYISHADGKYWAIVNADPGDDVFEEVTHWHPLPGAIDTT